MAKRIILNTLKVLAAVTAVYVIAIVILTAISPKLFTVEEDEDYFYFEDEDV